LKPHVELRGADSGPLSHVLALPALFVGILYDSASRTAALELIKDWTGSEIDQLRHQVLTAIASASLDKFSGLALCVLAIGPAWARPSIRNIELLRYPCKSLFQHNRGSGPYTRPAMTQHCLQVPKAALRTVFRGEPLQSVAQTVVKLASEGLRRRGRGEQQYLEPLRQIADSGITKAERMLALYHGAWGGSLDPLYDGSFDY